MDGGSHFRKWDEVVPDVLALIFMKLSLFELLMVVPSVCKSWQQVIMGPYCWQEIDIVKWCREWGDHSKVHRMLQLLIPRSCGTLRKLSVCYATNDGINIIANHAQSLRTLNLLFSETIDASAIEKAAPLLSTITSLDMCYSLKLGARGLYAIGTHCKSLTSLRLRMTYGQFTNAECVVIASTCPHLKSLVIPGSIVDTSTIIKILENCKHLELLDIRNNWVKVDEEIFKAFPMVKVMEGYDARIISDQKEYSEDEEEDDYNYECDCFDPGSPYGDDLVDPGSPYADYMGYPGSPYGDDPGYPYGDDMVYPGSPYADDLVDPGSPYADDMVDPSSPYGDDPGYPYGDDPVYPYADDMVDPGSPYGDDPVYPYGDDPGYPYGDDMVDPDYPYGDDMVDPGFPYAGYMVYPGFPFAVDMFYPGFPYANDVVYPGYPYADAMYPGYPYADAMYPGYP